MQTSPRTPRPRALAILACFVATPALAQPANNACQNAIAIAPGTTIGTTVNATNDGSCDCGAAGSSPDVWYRYTAPSTGTTTITACNAGTNYDSVISIHTGCPGTTSNQITCNDDACGFNITFSTVAFNAVSGSTYYIRLAGFTGETGSFELTLSAPGSSPNAPPNDDCANAIAVGNGTIQFDNTGATTDSPANCGSNGSDIWYAYTAPAAAAIQIDTCSGTLYDSVVAVYAGTCGALTQLACNDDSCGIQSTVQFTAAAGQTYLISVGGWSSQTGSGTLSIGTGPEPTTGADVFSRDYDAVNNWGAIGGIRGYSISTYTCNLGDANLNWNGSTNQHPVMGMHLYRLENGAIEQIGLSWCKNATNAGAGAGCSASCNGQGGTVLGAGCQDVYGAVGNGMQNHLGPRSDVNAFTGQFTFPFPIGNPSGDAIYKRIQVRESDMNPATHPSALYFIEGVWVAPDDAAAGNGLNNSSHRRVNIAPTTYDITTIDSTRGGRPAIYAWQEYGGGIGTPDANVEIVEADVPGEGRFLVGSRVFDNGNGTWRYEYAVFNLNSHRSGGAFTVAIPPGTAVTNVGFHDVDYHSGDPYDNTDWTSQVSAGQVRWTSPQTHAQNPNSNALRWGTLYNFRFTANVAPASGGASIGLFRPALSDQPASVALSIATPGGAVPCPADWNRDGTVSAQDIFDLLASYFMGNADFNNSGATSSQDIFDFLTAFFTPCT